MAPGHPQRHQLSASRHRPRRLRPLRAFHTRPTRRRATRTCACRSSPEAAGPVPGVGLVRGAQHQYRRVDEEREQAAGPQVLRRPAAGPLDGRERVGRGRVGQRRTRSWPQALNGVSAASARGASATPVVAQLDTRHLEGYEVAWDLLERPAREAPFRGLAWCLDIARELASPPDIRGRRAGDGRLMQCRRRYLSAASDVAAEAAVAASPSRQRRGEDGDRNRRRHPRRETRVPTRYRPGFDECLGSQERNRRN